MKIAKRFFVIAIMTTLLTGSVQAAEASATLADTAAKLTWCDWSKNCFASAKNSVQAASSKTVEFVKAHKKSVALAAVAAVALVVAYNYYAASSTEEAGELVI